MPFLEPLWKKIERQNALREQYPEFDVAQSPDKVLQVDNYRLRNGGPVSEWSQTVMRLARHAAGLSQETERGMPDQLQVAADWEMYKPREKRAGVPRGVAEAFPETAVDRKVYDSGSAAPSINLTGSLLDNQEGLPGPLKSALNTPVLGTVLREGARPANWMSAAIAPLSFAPEAGIGARLGAEVAASAAGALAGQFVEQKAHGLPGPLPQVLGLGANIATGLATGSAVSSAGGNPLRAFRQATEGLPVGASLKDVSGGLPDDLAGGGAPSFADALDSLKNAVRTEAKLRNTGVVESEIRAGRGRQFGSVRNSIQQAMESGLSGEELARQARAGAAVGGLRRTVAEPLQLTQQQRDALFDEVMTRVADPKQDAGLYLTTTRALQKALDGEGLQPHEIRALQPLLGNDMATALAGRAVPAGDVAGAVERAARGGGPKLGGKSGLPATGPNIPKVGRGKQAQPERMGDYTRQRIAQEEADKKYWASQIGKSAPKFEERATGAGPQLGSTTNVPSPSLARKAADPLRDPRAEQNYFSGLREGIKAAEKEQLRRVGPSEDNLMERARQLLSVEERTSPLPGAKPIPTMRREVEDALNIWLQGNRELLDGMGTEGSQLIANINAQLTGNVADSYLTAALSRKNILAESLRATWGDVADEAAAIERDKIIGRATEALFQRELKVRYPEGVPERIRELIKTTRPTPYGESLGALTTFTQRAKNSMFGVADVSVFGVQGVNAIRRGGVPLFAASINKFLAAMHMPHVATMYSETMLPKQIQYGLDGVKQGAATGVFARRQGNKEVGSLFQYLGPVGRAVDKPYMAVADKMSQWQFGTVLGSLRNAAYEGNLVMAHLLGQDITNATVRRAAADNANAIGSFAESALRKSRAQKEGVALLSAPMTRARVKQITQMANLIKPTANPTERIVAASTIISTVGFTLAAGQLLNDYIGIGDFEYMPGKPGFGKITTASGMVIDVIPQDSVENAFAKAIQAVMAEDPTEALKVVGNLAIGSQGPAPRILTGAFGVGYERGQGYRYGDMGGDLKGRVLNLAPIPPIIPNLVDEGFDPLAQGLEQVGISNYQESAYAKASRVFEQETGGNWKDATPREKSDFKEAHPDIAAGLEQDQIDRGGPEGALAQKRVDARTEQEADDARLLSNEIDWDQWKDNRTRRLSEVRGFSESVYGTERIEKPENAYEEWLNVVRDNETPDGIDWDAVDAWVAQQDPDRQNFIEDNTGLYGTKLEKERRAVAGKLDDAGYFENRDKVWKLLSSRSDSLGKYEKVDDFRAAVSQQIRSFLSQRGVSDEATISIVVSDLLDEIPVLKLWSELSNDVEEAWIVKNRSLANEAVKYGYIKPGSLRDDEKLAVITGASR